MHGSTIRTKCSLFLQQHAVQFVRPRRRIFHQHAFTHVQRHMQGKGSIPSVTAMLNVKCNEIWRKKDSVVDLLERHLRTTQKIWARLNAFVFPIIYGMAVQWVFLPG
jgi:Ribonuclease G/E